MAHADNPIPEYKTYAEGEPIPPVDPEDIKRLRPRVRIEGKGWSWKQDMKAKLSPGADYTAVHERCDMIATMYIYKLLTPWQRGAGFDDAVFRVAATLPLRRLEHKSYMISGDEQFGFDPNAFVKQLIEETGIPHVWEPVQTKIPEGGRCLITSRTGGGGSIVVGAATTKREAKGSAQEVLWHLWKRFSPIGQVLSKKELPPQRVATSFDNFLLNNMDLVRQLEDAFMDPQHISSAPILSELEQRAQRSPGK